MILWYLNHKPGGLVWAIFFTVRNTNFGKEIAGENADNLTTLVSYGHNVENAPSNRGYTILTLPYRTDGLRSTQIAFDIELDNNFYIRTKIDGTYTGWKKLITNSDMYAKPLNTDLNGIRIPGSYVQPANSGATTALHYPVVLAGFLEVIGRTDSDWILQRYTPWDTSTQTYKRTFYQGSWRDWVTT